jgi:hypothetical protein
MVIGLDADFSLLQNANTMCFSDFFKGLAYYMVYDSPASGSYNVIDWNNPNFSINNNDGYAYVFSFENCIKFCRMLSCRLSYLFSRLSPLDCLFLCFPRLSIDSSWGKL